MKTVKQLSSYEMIWEIVRQIPKGRVATYGEVATESGFPGQARLVGYALHSLPQHGGVPWQRVVNAQGRISFPRGSSAYARQRRLLRAEGVIFQGDAIDLQRFGWLKAFRR
ncbi:MAG: MGMT family protein [Ignavibacteriales bacterium]|nr:MGMT family protein [Ignavibacteriales bacterium]